jgi:hypothetical protein
MKQLKKILILSMILVWAYQAQSQSNVEFYITDGIVDTVIKSAIENNSSLFLSEIGKACIEGRTPDFTNIAVSPEASKTILDIWINTSVMNCSVSKLERKCIKRYDGGYQIRSIPIYMVDAAENDRQQEIAINYTASGEIDEVSIYDKDMHGIATMLTEGAEVKELWRRQRIQDFVDEFRTAYNTKNLSFLDTVYSDKALIITGKVIKTIPSDASVKAPDERIEYITQTKAQYMRKMKLIFAANKYINLIFEDIKIQQHPKYPELYGVVFKQHWNTSSYNDKGYVFLMIDFRDENAPVIHIRTWQPSMFKGEKLSQNEIFGVTSFNITR